MRALAAWLVYEAGETPPAVEALVVLYARAAGRYVAAWTGDDAGSVRFTAGSDRKAICGLPRALLARLAGAGLPHHRLVGLRPAAISTDEFLALVKQGERCPT